MKKEPIRIAHVVGKWVGGGVESTLMNYYKNINRDKYNFDFIIDEDSIFIPKEEIESLGGRVIIVSPYQKIFKYIRELKKIFKKGKYDIVHSHVNTLAVFSLYAAKKAGIKIRISHSHSTTNKKEKKKNIIKKILRPFSTIYATDYFSCSEIAGRWQFGEKNYLQKKVYIMNNAIDLKKFQFNKIIRKKKRNELKINENEIIIGHVGRFVSVKNHEFLIEIFKELKEINERCKLMLVGQGPLENIIKEKIRENHLEDSVIFLGQRNDIDELYQAMDYFVLPSLYEGLGMVLIEAQSVGLPCTCSTEVPINAKITNNLDFLSLDENPKVWARNILNNYKKTSRTNNLKEIIESGYDITKEVTKLEKKYDELINKKVF